MLRRLCSALLPLTVLAAALPRTVTAQSHGYSWSFAGTDGGVRVAQSSVTRHKFDAIKASVIARSPVARLFTILQDFEQYTAWYYRVADVRVLRRPETALRLTVNRDGRISHAPGAPWVLYFRQRTPPLEDRWTVLQCELRAGPGGSLRIAFRSAPGYPYRAPQDATRMSLRGYWQLRPLGDARTEVTFMVDVDPNTSAPAFLVDPQIRDAVVETLRALQRRARAPTRGAVTPRNTR